VRRDASWKGSHIRQAHRLNTEEEIMPNLEGVDVSHHEGAIGWDKVKDAGIAFAILKATEGKSFVDPPGAVRWASWPGCTTSTATT
jgi:lysozyme